VDGEASLDAYAVSGNTPHCELGVGPTAPGDADDRAAHELDTLSVAFHDPEVDLYVVSHAEVRPIGLESDVLLELLFFD